MFWKNFKAVSHLVFDFLMVCAVLFFMAAFFYMGYTAIGLWIFSPFVAIGGFVILVGIIAGIVTMVRKES